MIRGAKPFLAVLVLLAGCSLASAQDATIGAGKVEIGGFPGGAVGTFNTIMYTGRLFPALSTSPDLSAGIM